MTPESPDAKPASSEDTQIMRQGRPAADGSGDLTPPAPTPYFTEAPPPKGGRPMSFWIAVGATATTLVLAGLLVYSYRVPKHEMPAPPPPSPEAAAALQEILKPYVEKAQQGDTHAMRMLGVMYYHGLDLPRDRPKGLGWYHKAADSGSKVAVDELKDLEGPRPLNPQNPANPPAPKPQ